MSWIDELLENHSPGPFKPYMCYSEVGDEIYVYLSDEPSITRQLCPYLAVLCSQQDPSRITGIVLSSPDYVMKEGTVELAWARVDG